MKSILQEKDKRQCYLCKMGGDTLPKIGLQEHHIFGGANRKLSEKYGLKVYLCNKHHIYGEEAVHRPDLNDNGKLLKQIGQAAFMRKYMEEHRCDKQQAADEFRKLFGKNYIEDLTIL